MKKFLKTHIYLGYLNLVLLFVRIGVGFLMMTHGVPKMQKLFAGGDIKFADTFGIGPTPTLALVVFAEVICSALIILGLFTRLAVIPLTITMAIAAFVIHGSDPIGDKEASLMYLMIYLIILAAGPGRYSVDRLLFK